MRPRTSSGRSSTRGTGNRETPIATLLPRSADSRRGLVRVPRTSSLRQYRPRLGASVGRAVRAAERESDSPDLWDQHVTMGQVAVQRRWPVFRVLWMLCAPLGPEVDTGAALTRFWQR